MRKDSETPNSPHYQTVRRWTLGSEISLELSGMSLRPSRALLKPIAAKFCISITEAQRALSAYQNPHGIDEIGRKLIKIRVADTDVRTHEG